MVDKTFLTKRKRESFFKKAQKEKVRARSYYKLEQIDKKFNLIKNDISILDLGCAPGGWLEYIDKKVQKADVIGIDLLEVKNPKEFSENIEIIEDDFNNLHEYTDKEFDLIISDMAPEFSGDSRADRGRTHKINILVLDFCKDNLRKGGHLVFKTFEGEDLDFVRKKAKEMFAETKDFKPESSQKKTSEFYIVCQNKRS